MQKIGVREIVEFVLQSGDLNNSLPSYNSAKNGSRIHRKIQKKYPQSYQSEYFLEHEIKINNKKYLLNGRADGVLFTKNHVLIEEIKTSDLDFNEIPENKMNLYWGQLQAYASIIFSENNNIDSIDLKLTYVRTPEEEITEKIKSYKKSEAQTFLDQLIKEYSQWLALKDKMLVERNTSVKNLKFPFKDYRPGQYEFAKMVYKSVISKKHLFAEAPTGTGKTISTLFPAIKAFSSNYIQKIFYLTAKQSTRIVAENAINLLKNNGLKLRSITLTAKEKITFPEEKDLTPDQNPYMIGYYDRLKPALKDILENNHQITKNVIEIYAKKHKIDPFEFSLDISLFCDVIIGDYNYLFDPVVHLQRFFEVENDDYFFLIDEAHNLVDRSRDMYSTEINDSETKNALEKINEIKNQKKLINEINNLLAIFENYNDKLDDNSEINYELPNSKLSKTINKIITLIRKLIRKKAKSKEELDDDILQFFFNCLHYQKINDLYGENYRTRIIKKDNHLIINLFCINPSPFINGTLELGRGSILFSATLSPIKYYQEMLGNNPDSLQFQINSPFNPNNNQIIIDSSINTKFNNRDQSINNIILSIKYMIQKKGNYLIFIPSINYLNKIYEAFNKKYPNIRIIKQTSEMNEIDRSNFINNFKEYPSESLVGFALLGGIFSEGIDLQKSRLIGVGIVGVGLPAMNPENNLIRDYFDQQKKPGFSYAYQLPGINNVFQAAGRLIRTDDDKGIILLMDERFIQNRYKQLFPYHWKNILITRNKNNLSKIITKFWN
ncbi:helicase C-terminal domain-containing protein [Lactobacillus sp. S2-2]|uniref:helicase C-terminal domain-containing protein n=1 Tax=Lactobacillus sp. S2-2 TaxID=2692917 RepID=UPI001EFFF53C